MPLTEKNPVVGSPVLAPKTQTISEPKPDAIKPLTLEDFRNHWSKIIEGLEKKNSKISHFLEEAKLTSFDGNQLLIELINGHRFHLKTLEKDAEQIALVINDKLGQKIKIKIHIQEDRKSVV